MWHYIPVVWASDSGGGSDDELINDSRTRVVARKRFKTLDQKIYSP